MRKQVEIRQRTPNWFAWRKGKIGASDVSAIIGENPFKTALELFEQKMLDTSTPVNDAMQRGIDYEDEARQAACNSLGIAYEEACFEHCSRPYLISSLDGWKEGQGALEIKVPGKDAHALAMGGMIPSYYIPQCQAIMLVTKTDSMFYASYDPATKQLATVMIKRDSELCDRIEQAAEDFHRRMINFDPPEPSERDYPRFADANGLELRVREAKLKLEELKAWEKVYDGLKEEAIAQTGNRNAYLGEMRITKVISKGRIQYKDIPQLKELDLEAFRSHPVTSYRIS